MDLDYNYINLIQLAGNILEILLLRVLLDPINRKGVGRKTKIAFCCSVQIIVVAIAVLHVGSFVYVLINSSENQLFLPNQNKTILLLWVEIQIMTVPIKILYYMFTSKTLLMNRKLKHENLNNPNIKEAICEGAGL